MEGLKRLFCWFWLVCVLVFLVAAFAAMVHGQEKQPTLALQPESALWVFHSDGEFPPERVCRLIVRDALMAGYKTCVIHRDTHIPILIPKDKLGKVRELLGAENVLNVVVPTHRPPEDEPEKESAGLAM
jgi:hypothetical protein